MYNIKRYKNLYHYGPETRSALGIIMLFYHEEFKQLCKEKRWSNSCLGEKCGVSRQTVGKWKSGEATPSEKNIRKLAHALEVSISSISAYKNNIAVSKLKISDTVDSILAYAELAADKHHRDYYKTLVDIAAKQYKGMIQTSFIVKAILNTIPSIFYVKDVDSKYVIASKDFISNLGLKAGFDVLGEVDSDFFPNKEAKANFEEDLKVIQTGIPVYRDGLIFGSRRKKWGLISKTPILEDGKVIGVLGVIMDFTAKKKQEKALLFLLSNISKLHDKKIYYAVADKNKNFIYYDRDAYEEVLGIPSSVSDQECTDYWLENISHPDDREEQKAYVSNMSFPPVREHRIIHPKKGLCWIRTTTLVYMDNFMSFSEDITEEKAKKNN